MPTKKRCPKCGSSAIDFYAGAVTGLYHCKQCGYVGAIIIEEDDLLSKEKRYQEKQWMKKKSIRYTEK